MSTTPARLRGVVVRYYVATGYGWIRPLGAQPSDAGHDEAFFHCSAMKTIRDAGPRLEGAEVVYSIHVGADGRQRAIDVCRV